MLAQDGLDLPALLGGRYRPVRLLGAGGMGRVYEVVHEHTGEHLALKILAGLAHDAEAVARFRREARTFATIGGEHIARVVDAGTLPELGDTPYLAMELLQGEDLGKRLSREGPQEPPDVVSWARQIAAALDRAHRAGVVHRDLKPGNVFLALGEGGDTRVKVIDFGVAKVSDQSSHTAPGAILGTPRYAAPEQAEGTKDVGPEADQWSLAMVVFSCLSGRAYFDGGTMTQVLSQLLFSDVVPPSRRGCPAGGAFDAWFVRSCARDPRARWPSVTAQVDALATALSGVARLAGTPSPGNDVTVTAHDASPRPDAGRAPTVPAIERPRRSWLGWTAAAAVVVVAGSVWLTTLFPRVPPERSPSVAAEPPASSSPPAPPPATSSSPEARPTASASATAPPRAAPARPRPAPTRSDPFATQK